MMQHRTVNLHANMPNKLHLPGLKSDVVNLFGPIHSGQVMINGLILVRPVGPTFLSQWLSVTVAKSVCYIEQDWGLVLTK